MIIQSKFSDVLESVESLRAEDKEMLIDIVRSRMVEERRARIRSEIEESRQEYAAGLCDTMAADRIMKEVLS